MEEHTFNLSTQEAEQADLKASSRKTVFKICLGYRVSSKSAWKL